MVTKRKPPKQNNEQGAPGKPARPSVKGKAVARPEVRPEAATAGSGDAAANAANQAGAQVAAPGKPKRRIAMPQSSTRLKQNQAANQASPAQAGETGASQSVRQSASRPVGPSAAQPARPSVSQQPRPSASKRGAGKPTKARKPLNVPSVQPGGDGKASASAGESAAPAEQASAAQNKAAGMKRRLKRFSVAKAEKTASDQAKQMEGTVSEADADRAKDAARAAIAGEAAKRRLERRQRMLKHTGEGEGAAAGQGAIEGDAAQSREAGEGSQAGETARKLPFNVPKLQLTWPVVAVLVAIAVVVVTVGTFSWNRWLRYDDAADFQGAWYANGTTSLVTVDGQEIHLTSDVAYGYTLDTGAKTITFTFADLQGQGRYRFSADRSELVITDGDGFSFWGNLFSDIGWQFGQLISGLQGKEVPREEVVDGVTVLDRTPGEGAVKVPASSIPAQDVDASSADDTASDDANAGESVDGDSVDGGSGSGSQGFTGAVAEGGIESAGSNAVTLEQLKSGSLR